MSADSGVVSVVDRKAAGRRRFEEGDEMAEICGGVSTDLASIL